MFAINFKLTHEQNSLGYHRGGSFSHDNAKDFDRRGSRVCFDTFFTETLIFRAMVFVMVIDINLAHTKTLIKLVTVIVVSF